MSSTPTAVPSSTRAPRHFDLAGRVLRRWFGTSLLGVVALGAGCSVVKHETVATKSLLQSFTGKAADATRTNAVAALQSKVMREADQYVGAVAQATDDFHKQVGTTEARNAAQQWKLNEATVAYVNATDENPVVGAGGMVVHASLSRMVIEDYLVGEELGAAKRGA